jgi:hypothetical protein
VDAPIDHVDHFTLTAVPALMQANLPTFRQHLSAAQGHDGFSTVNFNQDVLKARLEFDAF